MAKKKPISNEEMVAFIQQLEDVADAAHALSERIFVSLDDDPYNPVIVMQKLSRAFDRLANLNQLVAGKAAKREYQRDLEVKMRAELAAQKTATV